MKPAPETTPAVSLDCDQANVFDKDTIRSMEELIELGFEPLTVRLLT